MALYSILSAVWRVNELPFNFFFAPMYLSELVLKPRIIVLTMETSVQFLFYHVNVYPISDH